MMESSIVSYFENIKTQKKNDVPIDRVFELISSGYVKKDIELLRKTLDQKEREQIKQRLPAITVSGTFINRHSQNDFLQHSGLIQIDIDNVQDTKKIKELLSKDIFTLCTFISPSGNGVKVIVKINPGSHKESFSQLEKYYLNKYKLPIDKKCKDITRLMFLSYDRDIFINENSMQFNPISQDVEKIISQIELKKIDVTSSYENWLNIGFAFADSFNEGGRELFHRVSVFYPQYVKDKCNEQFNECLKKRKKGITIKTFFKIANDFEKNEKLENNKNILLPEKIIIPAVNENKGKGKIETSKFYIVESYLNETFNFRYNEVSNEIEWKEISTNNGYKPFNENNLYRHLQHQNISFSMPNLLTLLRSDFVSIFNPFKEYFNSLPKWDGKTDHILKLCGYIKTKDQERFNLHFKKALVRCVACSLEHGFNKHAFILTGGQSSGKTTFIRWLCPSTLDGYYTEHINKDKDSEISLCENLIINLDELACFDRKEINAFKSMLSRDVVKIRRPFDKKATTSKRRANFFGSTNKDEFLADETGSVRWLCFEILKINWSYKKEIDINQIWAQAFELFNNGFKYELTAEEIDENENANADFQQRSLELELVQKYFVRAKKGDEKAVALTSTDILQKLKETTLIANNLTVQNIGKAMRSLGYSKVSERLDNSIMPIKVYWVKCKE